MDGSYLNLAMFAAQERLLAGRTVSTIWDVGANIGNTVAQYMADFPEASICAFEPQPEVFKEISSRFSGSRKVRCFPLAISDSKGTARFYVNDFPDTNSLFPRSRGRRYWGSENQPADAIEVQCATLDDIAADLEVRSLDILKMDMQGGEMRAVRGAKSLLGEQRISVILAEVFFVPHYEGAPLFHELTAELAAFDYTLHDLFELTRASNGQLRFADALYVSRAIRRDVIDRCPPEP